MTTISEKPTSNIRTQAGERAGGEKSEAGDEREGCSRAPPFTPSPQDFDAVSFFTSPSIVWPAVGWISPDGGADLSSSVFMPSLKPFTALPRSVPMLRSFLVPNISTTTTSTINQCQMLNEPILQTPLTDYLRDAFSSTPEIPSRLCNSASTSSLVSPCQASSTRQ